MTITLIVAEKRKNKKADAPRFGGYPMVPDGQSYVWPCCKKCNEEMRFMFQIPHMTKKKGYYQFFECMSPAGCETWEADNGTNAVRISASKNLVPAKPAKNPEAIADYCFFVRTEKVAAKNYSAALKKWDDEKNKDVSNVVGVYGGQPAWIQYPEVPKCNHCKKKMRFVAQLEEGLYNMPIANFGFGGCGYVFDCPCSEDSTKLVWQCG